MVINVKGDNLILTFKYDPKLVEAVRSVPGRIFEVKNKRWIVPVENIAECLEILVPWGFQPTLEVKRLAEEKRALWAKYEEIRANPGKYEGNLPLFEFQKVGAAFLHAMPGALLADAPGLGKTLQVIASSGECEKILVFCPASLKYSWEAEIKKWAPNETVVVVDGFPANRKKLWRGNEKWVIANYELILRDFHDIMAVNWCSIVCDEATRISNSTTKTARLIKVLNCKRKIALTGTPISNTPLDIYSIIDWIAPHYFGNFYQFKEKYCEIEPRFNRVTGYKNLGELAAKVNRFLLRRTKEEVLKDFPPKVVEDIVFDLNDREKEFYKAIKSQILEELKGTEFNKITLGIIPVKMLRLKQATNHPKLLGKEDLEPTKLETLMEILRPIVASGEKTIIFSQFAEMAKILAYRLERDTPIIYGEVPTEERQRIVEKFNTDPAAKFLVMTEAGAYGLNLQGASYVIHYDLPWSVAKLQQREDRAHRIGQTKPVTVYNLIAKNTIDEYVAKVLHKKQKTSVEILGDDDRLEAAGFSEEDIQNILRL